MGSNSSPASPLRRAEWLTSHHLHKKLPQNATLQTDGHHIDTQPPCFPHLTFKTMASLMIRHPLPTSSTKNFHYRRFSHCGVHYLHCSCSRALALQVLALRGAFAAVLALISWVSPVKFG